MHQYLAALLLLLYFTSSVEMVFWRFHLSDGLEAHTSVPFHLKFEDINHWTDNNSWYTSSSNCLIGNPQNSSSRVSCSNPGKVYFGFLDSSNPFQIKEMRSVFVKPSQYCFKWQIEYIKVGERINLKISIVTLTDEQKEMTNPTNVFFESYEAPLITKKYFTLDRKDELLTPLYNTSEESWFASTLLPDTDYVYVDVASRNDIHNNFCYVRPTRILLHQPKFELTSPHVKKVENMILEMPDQIIQDPFKATTSIIVHEKQAHLEGFTFNISHESLVVKDLVLLGNHAVFLTQQNQVLAWERISTNRQLVEIHKVNGQDWLDIFASRISKKGHQGEEVVILLSSNRKNGFFYIYNPARDVNSTDWKQIPFCTHFAGNCSIQHVEVSSTLNLARFLVHTCYDELTLLQQMICDYYHAEDIFMNCTLFYSNVTFTDFVFLPSFSNNILLFSENTMSILKGHNTTAIYKLNDMEKFDGLKSVSGDVVLVKVSSGDLVFYQFGSKDVYKVYDGLQVMYTFNRDTGEIYSYKFNNQSGHFDRELARFNLELDAQKGDSKPSIYSFKSSIENTIYYLDRNTEILVIYDQNIGLTLEERTSLSKTKNNVRQINKIFSLKLSSQFRNLYWNLLEKNTSVVFSMVNYKGYSLEKQFHSKPLFVMIGCPPNRNLLLNSKKLNSNGETIKTNISQIEAQEKDEVEIILKVFADSEYLEAAHGKIKIYPISALTIQQTNTLSSTIVVDFKTIGQFDINIEVELANSLCILRKTVHVVVTDGGQFERTLIIIISISFCIIVCGVAMFISFLMFKKETEREHETQARQAQLRYLASIMYYQEQMDISASHPAEKTKSSFSETAANRRNSIARRRSSVARRRSYVARKRSSEVAREHIDTMLKGMGLTIESPE